jgi:hypothetical protein
MDQTTMLTLLLAVGVGVIVVLSFVGGIQRHRTEPDESPFATSTEGMKVCPTCRRPNLWTDATCLHCGHRLRG